MTTYQRLGGYIREVNVRNRDEKVTKPMGINIDKHFMPSVANVIGTDLSAYKLVSKNQFACNLMHVGRDEKIPMAMQTDDNPIIVSPAYFVFEISQTEVLLPEYLMMWFSRPEFDRNAWFYTDADVRGGMDKSAFMDMMLPIPSIERQREIVEEYETLSRRISLNEQMIQKLEATAQALYRKMFVDGIDKENLPKGWRFSILGDFCELITKGTTPSNYQAKGMISFIKAESFMPNHSLAKDRFAYIDEYTHTVILKRSILCENDVLFTIAGTLGKFCMVTKDYLPANTNQAVAIIRVNKQKIHPQVLFTMLLSGIHEDYCKRNIQQAVQANLSLETLHNMPLLYPPTNTLALFHKQIEPVIDTLFIKYKEIEKLTELQSLLLAKMGNLKQ